MISSKLQYVNNNIEVEADNFDSSQFYQIENKNTLPTDLNRLPNAAMMSNDSVKMDINFITGPGESTKNLNSVFFKTVLFPKISIKFNRGYIRSKNDYKSPEEPFMHVFEVFLRPMRNFEKFIHYNTTLV